MQEPGCRTSFGPLVLPIEGFASLAAFPRLVLSGGAAIDALYDGDRVSEARHAAARMPERRLVLPASVADSGERL
jgi:hypothetical protein